MGFRRLLFRSPRHGRDHPTALMPSRRDLLRRRDLRRRTRHPRGGTVFTLAGIPTSMFDLENGRRTGHSLERAWKVTVEPMDSQHRSRAYALLTVYNWPCSISI